MLRIYLLAISSIFTHWPALGKWIGVLCHLAQWRLCQYRGMGRYCRRKALCFLVLECWTDSSLLSLSAPAECSCLISPSFCPVGSQKLPLGWFYSEGHFSANSFHRHVRAHISSKFCQRGTTANALPFIRPGLCTVLQGLYLSLRGERAFSMMFPLSFKGSDCSL